MLKHVLPAMLALAALGAADGDGAKPEKPAKEKAPALTLADLPEAAKAVVEAQSAGAKVDRIQASDKGGAKSYRVRFARDGVKTELTVTAEGKVTALKAERSDGKGAVPTDKLPEAVRNAIAAKTGDGVVVEVEEELQGDAMGYEVEIRKADGSGVDLEIAADGTITKEEAVAAKPAKPAKEPKPGKEGKDKKPEGGEGGGH